MLLDHYFHFRFLRVLFKTENNQALLEIAHLTFITISFKDANANKPTIIRMTRGGFCALGTSHPDA